jgi:parvulin-like peptidyl-prolyl isomerase
MHLSHKQKARRSFQLSHHQGEDMKTKNLLIAALMTSLFCWSAPAQEQPQPVKAPRVTHRQINQQTRIKQGVKSGKLTKQETRRLKMEQAKIQHDKKAAKSDGTVTPEERQKIRREQKKASRDIYRKKHNDKMRK